MVIKMNKFKLTEREKDILEILWKADKPLAGSDFGAYDNGLKKNTAVIYLRKLLLKKLIVVHDFEMRGKAITRTYLPALSKHEYEIEKYFQELEKLEINVAKFACAFVEKVDYKGQLDELVKLEKVVAEKIAKLKGKKK